jgi:hypothetical protein
MHAVRLFAAEATWRAQHVGRAATLWTLSSVPGADEELGALRAALGEAAFVDAWTAGQQLPLEQAIAQALELS